jgi:hypothetical protein
MGKAHFGILDDPFGERVTLGEAMVRAVSRDFYQIAPQRKAFFGRSAGFDVIKVAKAAPTPKHVNVGRFGCEP